MGFFGRLKSFGGKVLGGVGRVVRKVAEFTTPVIKAVGAFAKPAAGVLGSISAAMGHPELAGAFSAASRIADAVGSYAPKVGNVVHHAGAVATKMERTGDKWR